MDDATVDQMLGSILQQRLKLSAKAIQAAKEAAWNDLPMNERRTYLNWAERAVMEDLKEQKPS